MGYTAGTLDLSVLGTSEGAIASIEKTVKSLNSLSRAINKINQLPVLSASSTLTMFFTKLADSTNRINTENIKSLANAAKSLSSISKLTKLDSMNWDNVASGFGKLTVAITPFVNKVKEAEVSLTALYGVLNKSSGKKISGILNDTSAKKSSQKGSGIGNFLHFGKLSAILYTARRLGRIIGDLVKGGAAYTETLNLWETSMGKNLSIATEFVNKMNEAYGVSEKTLMNAQAIFKNMLGSLGQISDSMAYSLSEGITQMALDYASLYNVKFADAFNKFQAALAGQVRPIRSVSGYDITENTLFQLYQSLGGTKTMRQLSRTEKQLLSILAIFNQMSASGAVGDLDKTMESFANQSRVTKESFQQLTSYAGILLTYFIQESRILTYINAALIYVSELLKRTATELGAIQHFGSVFGDIGDEAYDTADAIDELNGKLLDFDKFRSMSGGAAGEGIGLDSKLLNALSNYKTILEGANMEARELAEKWLTVSDVDWEQLITQGLNAATTILNGFKYQIANFDWEQSGANIGTFIADTISAFAKSGDFWISLVETIDILGIAFYEQISGAWKAFFSDTSWQDDAFNAFEELLKWLGQRIVDNFVDAFNKSINMIIELFEEIYPMFADIINGLIDAINFLFKSDIQRLPNYLEIQKFGNGGLPDKGTVFMAGEAGAEMLYNMPNGQSGVANVQQIEQAMYNALVAHDRTTAVKDATIRVYLDGEEIYNNTTAHAKKRGNTWGKV
jgi:hypothetical protein